MQFNFQFLQRQRFNTAEGEVKNWLYINRVFDILSLLSYRIINNILTSSKRVYNSFDNWVDWRWDVRAQWAFAFNSPL